MLRDACVILFLTFFLNKLFKYVCMCVFGGNHTAREQYKIVLIKYHFMCFDCFLLLLLL